MQQRQVASFRSIQQRFNAVHGFIYLVSTAARSCFAALVLTIRYARLRHACAPPAFISPVKCLVRQPQNCLRAPFQNNDSAFILCRLRHI